MDCNSPNLYLPHSVSKIREVFVRYATGSFTAGAVKVCERLEVRTAWSRRDVTCREVGRGAQPLHFLVCHVAAMLLLADVNWTVLFPFSGLNNDEPARRRGGGGVWEGPQSAHWHTASREPRRREAEHGCDVASSATRWKTLSDLVNVLQVE
jgi:hypothetical protein